MSRLGVGCRAAALTIGLTALAGCGTSADAARHNCATRIGVRPPVHENGSARATGNVINLDATDLSFSPTCISDVPAGTVTLVVLNSGTHWHNFSIPAQHVDRDLPADAAILVRVSVANAPVMFDCKYQRRRGMVGILIPETSRADRTGS